MHTKNQAFKYELMANHAKHYLKHLNHAGGKSHYCCMAGVLMAEKIKPNILSTPSLILWEEPGPIIAAWWVVLMTKVWYMLK